MIPATSFLASLASAAARSLLLAGAVGCGLWALRVRNVLAQKTAWILVLVASLAMPLLASWGARIAWLPDKYTFPVTGSLWSRTTVETQTQPVALTAKAFVARSPETEVQPPIAVEPAPLAHTSDLSRFPAPAIAHSMTDAPAAAPAAAPTPFLDRARAQMARLSPARGLLLLYLAVAGMLLLRLCFGAWTALRLWRRAEPIRLAAPGSAQVRCSRDLASPVTVAAGIVLPADYAGWDTEKLGIVLAHEGSHVRQRDFSLQLAASLHIALFWFNPLAWWLKRKLTDLSETISDGAAVHQAASHASYAQVLLEFAALPRPIPIGVAMAHRGHLRSRIEHLLNENSFRQAFSGGRLRLAAAVLLVPVALFGATAMVRVHAAAQQAPPATAPAPDPAPAPQAAPQPAAAPDQAPATTPAPAAPSRPGIPGAPDGTADIAPLPPSPPGVDETMILATPSQDGDIRIVIPKGKYLARNAQAMAMMKSRMDQFKTLNGRAFIGNGFFNDGNSYAYVTGEGEKNVHAYGGWFDKSREEIEKARKVAHGDFLWFERDGKSYVIDDPALLASLKPMQEQMDTLGKQQEELGRQQEELGKKQEELGRQMEQVKVPTPDMKTELAKLQAVEAKLSALQGKDASQQELGEIQGELADIQGRLGDLQGNMGGRMGELGGKMGELGGQQGKLGAQQGKLGAQQGRLGREMDGKVLTIIDEGLKDGKARPVQ